ncbi:MAG: class I SAM-dependent methyltransferase [Acidimicrobiales bacterium]
MSQRSEPDPHPASAPRTVPLVLPDLRLELITDRGVFSHHGVDAGTRFLLDRSPPPPAEGDLLDLGCGYGPIALAVARRAPSATVWSVDVDRRARALTAANAERAGLANVRVVSPDQVPPEVRFAALWSNPPIHIGKVPLRHLLVRWLTRLSADGWAVLVVHKYLGADTLAKWLAAEGFPTERLRSRRGYRLLQVGAPGPEWYGRGGATSPAADR